MNDEMPEEVKKMLIDALTSGNFDVKTVNQRGAVIAIDPSELGMPKEYETAAEFDASGEYEPGIPLTGAALNSHRKMVALRNAIGRLLTKAECIKEELTAHRRTWQDAIEKTHGLRHDAAWTVVGDEVPTVHVMKPKVQERAQRAKSGPPTMSPEWVEQLLRGMDKDALPKA